MAVSPNDDRAENNGANQGDASKEDQGQDRIIGLVHKEQVQSIGKPLPRIDEHVVLYHGAQASKYVR